MDRKNIKIIKKVLANRNKAIDFLDLAAKHIYMGKKPGLTTASHDIDRMYE